MDIKREILQISLKNFPFFIYEYETIRLDIQNFAELI